MNSRQQDRVIERGVVRALIASMRRKGWEVFRTFDGDVSEYPANADAAIAAVFNLDEVSLRFVPKAVRAEVDKVRGSGDCAAVRAAGDRAKRAEHGVLLVIGNAPDEIISDWNYREGDADGFNAAMEEFLGGWERDLLEVGRKAATDADRIAVAAGPWIKGQPYPVLLKSGRTFRNIGGARGTIGEALAMAQEVNSEARSITFEEVDAYPGGWAKQVFIAE